MLVRILEHPSHARGAVVELPAGEAVRLIEAGRAAPAGERPADARETRGA